MDFAPGARKARPVAESSVLSAYASTAGYEASIHKPATRPRSVGQHLEEKSTIGRIDAVARARARRVTHFNAIGLSERLQSFQHVCPNGARVLVIIGSVHHQPLRSETSSIQLMISGS
ncbi:MAG: hypothetical protein AB7U95_00330 [Reyranella sp.]